MSGTESKQRQRLRKQRSEQDLFDLLPFLRKVRRLWIPLSVSLWSVLSLVPVCLPNCHPAALLRLHVRPSSRCQKYDIVTNNDSFPGRFLALSGSPSQNLGAAKSLRSQRSLHTAGPESGHGTKGNNPAVITGRTLDMCEKVAALAWTNEWERLLSKPDPCEIRTAINCKETWQFLRSAKSQGHQKFPSLLSLWKMRLIFTYHPPPYLQLTDVPVYRTCLDILARDVNHRVSEQLILINPDQHTHEN